MNYFGTFYNGSSSCMNVFFKRLKTDLFNKYSYRYKQSLLQRKLPDIVHSYPWSNTIGWIPFDYVKILGCCSPARLPMSRISFYVEIFFRVALPWKNSSDCAIHVSYLFAMHCRSYIRLFIKYLHRLRVFYTHKSDAKQAPYSLFK